MPRSTREPAETPGTEQTASISAETEQAPAQPELTIEKPEQATEKPDQVTETLANKPAPRDWLGLIGRVLADWTGFSVRRPRKGLPAVALGFGLGLLCGGGLWLLDSANRFVALLIFIAGFPCIAWALASQDDRWDDE